MYEAKINWTERKNKLMHGYIFHNPPPRQQLIEQLESEQCYRLAS